MVVYDSHEQSENEIKEKITTGAKISTCIFTKGREFNTQNLLQLLIFEPSYYFFIWQLFRKSGRSQQYAYFFIPDRSWTCFAPFQMNFNHYKLLEFHFWGTICD